MMLLAAAVGVGLLVLLAGLACWVHDMVDTARQLRDHDHG